MKERTKTFILVLERIVSWVIIIILLLAGGLVTLYQQNQIRKLREESVMVDLAQSESKGKYESRMEDLEDSLSELADLENRVLELEEQLGDRSIARKLSDPSSDVWEVLDSLESRVSDLEDKTKSSW